jgi:hypothetical protein
MPEETKATRHEPMAESGEQGASAEAERDWASGALSPEAVLSAGEAINKGMAEIGQEVNRFVWTRLQADMEASYSLSTCPSLGVAIRRQRAFLERTVNDYTKETHRLADIVSTMVRDSMSVASEARRH